MLVYDFIHCSCFHSNKGAIVMPNVEIHKQAPDFALADFNGQEVSLSHFNGKMHVILVFNRGFV